MIDQFSLREAKESPSFVDGIVRGTLLEEAIDFAFAWGWHDSSGEIADTTKFV